MTFIRNHRTLAAAVCAVVIVVFTTTIVLVEIAQYEPAYAVKAGSQEIFKVKDKETAEKIIEDVMNEYTPQGAQVRQIVVDKKISTTTSSVRKDKADKQLMTEDEAVDYVLEQNAGDDPLFCVTVKANVSDVADVKANTRPTMKCSKAIWKRSRKARTAARSSPIRLSALTAPS